MNTEVLGLWMAVILCPLGIILLVAWLATGKTSAPLRVSAGLSVMLGMAGFAMAQYL